jgi:hypothetical protein
MIKSRTVRWAVCRTKGVDGRGGMYQRERQKVRDGKEHQDIGAWIVLKWILER